MLTKLSIHVYELKKLLVGRAKSKEYKKQGWLIELRFYVPSDTKYVISGMFFPANLLV